MEAEALRQAVAQAGIGALWVGFLTGLVFSFNPLALAAIPVSLGYVTASRTPRQAMLYGGLFILGMLLTHVALGLIASLGGVWGQQLLGREWGLVLGPLLIVLGLIWLGWLRVPLLRLPLRAKPVTAGWGAFVLGMPFSLAICPLCTPALVVLLGVAAGIGSPAFGITLLLAFALGRAVPIILGAAAVGWLENLAGLNRFRRVFEAVGGGLLVLSGLYLLDAYFFVVAGFVA